MTEWKKSDRFPWLEASSDGRIRRIIRFKRGPFPPVEIAGSIFNNGYRYIMPGGPSGRFKIGFHVLVCEVFHGRAPSPDHEVAHFDGNKDNNVPSNLSWTTPAGNAKDRDRHDKQYRGESHPSSKLKEVEVLEIFRLKRSGLTGKEIGDRFGLNRNTVNKISAGKSWAHLTRF